MKRMFFLLLILSILPLTKSQMIHRIRCRMPEQCYESLYQMTESDLRRLMHGCL